MKKIFLLLVVATLLYGCTVVYKSPDSVPATSQVQASNPSQSVATAVAPTPTPTPAPVQPPKTEQKALTIAETIAICQDIQKDKKIPVGCEVRYIQNNPAIYISFRNANAAAALWKAVEETITAPFCRATNAVNLQGVVGVIYTETQVARLYSCESDQWGEWFSLKENGSDQNDIY